MGKKGYWIGGFLILLAIAGGLGFVIARIIQIGDRIDEFPKGGLAESSVQLEARDYHVYLDVPNGTGGYSWTLAVRGPREQQLELRPTSTDITYDIGGREGELIGRMRVDEPGRYLIRGTGPPGARVVFGESIFGGIFSTVVGGLAIFFVLGGAGLALIIVTAVRGRGKQEPKRWP
jgi:hypothetical protein